jgi:hypothetical protein
MWEVGVEEGEREIKATERDERDEGSMIASEDERERRLGGGRGGGGGLSLSV